MSSDGRTFPSFRENLSFPWDFTPGDPWSTSFSGNRRERLGGGSLQRFQGQPVGSYVGIRSLLPLLVGGHLRGSEDRRE